MSLAKLGLIEVVNLPQDFCFKGNAAAILQQIASFLGVILPADITNVVVGNQEPPNTQTTALWIRTDGAGEFIGFYVVSGGAWIPYNGWNGWVPLFSGSGLMTVTLVSIDNARFTTDGQSVKYSIKANVTIGGTPDSAVVFTAPTLIAVPSVSAGNGWLDNTQFRGASTITSGTSKIGVRRNDGLSWVAGDATFSLDGVYEIG